MDGKDGKTYYRVIAGSYSNKDNAEKVKSELEKKGYTGYFITGFFLGIIGFVYVICLPDLIMRRYVKNCAKRNVPIEYHRQIEDEETDRVNEI